MPHPDLDDALSNLDDGLQLVLDRDGARWQHPFRRHLFFEVDRGEAEAIYDELEDRFEVRHHNGARILTPEPARDAPKEEETYLAEGHVPLKALASRIDHTYEGLWSAAKRGVFNVVTKPGPGLDGRTCAVAHAIVDEDLATYLAKAGYTGQLRTPAGQTLRLADHVETVHLDQDRYDHYSLGDLLGYDRATVGRRLSDKDLPRERSAYGRIEYPTCPALASALEEVFGVTVTIAAGDGREVAA